MAMSVKLDISTQNKLKMLAKQQNRSPHYIMVEAIKDYLEREEAREKFKKEALEAWVLFKETGLHLTCEETQNWLMTWGTDKEVGCPECHE